MNKRNPYETGYETFKRCGNRQELNPHDPITEAQNMIEWNDGLSDACNGYEPRSKVEIS